MTHPPGAVIVPCQETARYHRFTISLANLQLPAGSQRIFGIGTSIVQNLNDSIRRLRPQDEWVWIVGDDHVFDQDTLIRLLDTDLDMVAPLCARRGPPFPLVHYGDRVNDSSNARHVLQYSWLPEDGQPFEVKATGSLPLIRRDVLDAVGDPWFTNTPGKMDEEFGFCDKVRDAGFEIHVDPSIAVGHIGEMIVWPKHQHGVWGLNVEYVGADRHQVFYPDGIQTEVYA